MMNISHEQLNWVLTEGKVRPNKEVLARCKGSMETWTQIAAERMARSLPAIAHRHRVRQAQKPTIKAGAIEQLQKVRDGLDAALRALDATAPSLLDLLDQSIEPASRSAWAKSSISVDKQIETMRELRNSVENTRLAYESCGQHGTQEIQTYLFFDVASLYYEITGVTGIGRDDGGPLYRFAERCITWIDPDLTPTPPAFRKALRRQRKETTTRVGHLLG
jgi:hypothetical protein